ncbi:hypothetical protein PULV_a3888 [Pseudoalteromonas ulvae UL12]|uniref:hypothetical protein n=1 Tax=Pseudoalteromonas ulvae TaxID=107327 RepID=UPI00186B9D21|nr:hypothetical protein [Pseudoalteromonas ulvae]MBE0362093.1 hypothetical protein [Pseudoalteromonas ulvae UL12]
MPQFKANENYERHVMNMEYTDIQNAKAIAIDNEDWDSTLLTNQPNNNSVLKSPFQAAPLRFAAK